MDRQVRRILHLRWPIPARKATHPYTSLRIASGLHADLDPHREEPGPHVLESTTASVDASLGLDLRNHEQEQ